MIKNIINQNFLLFMKINLMQLILTGVFVMNSFASTANRQDLLEKKVSISLKKGNLKTFLKSIEKQTNVLFSYTKELVENDEFLTLEIRNEALAAVFGKVLTPRNITFEIVGERQIILNRTKSLGYEMKDNNLNQTEKTSLKSENNVVTELAIKGIVSDENGNKMPGVNINLKGTSRGSTTNTNGEYSISVPDANATLIFSFVGYKPKEIAISNLTKIDVTLFIDNKALDEVVVVGYGSVKKSDLTGSVSSINSKDLGDRQVGNIGSLIQGRASGVDVSDGKIRIRGVTTFNNTDPLVVIDGFIGGNLGTVNANDIANIEILKDASATAIYGARGANGVILITTKGGQIGPLKVNINVFSGVSHTPKKLPVLDASQYIDYLEDLLGNSGQSLTPELQNPNRRKDVTFWQDEVFKTGRNTEIDIDLSAGTEKAKFYLSMGYLQGESIVIGPKSSSFFIRNKNDFNISNWLRVGNNFAFNYSSATGSQPWDTGGMIGMPPYYGVYDPTNLGGFTNVNRNTDLTDVYNPIPISRLSHPESSSLGYQTNLWAELEPLKGLIYRLQAGVSGHFSRSKNWQDEYTNGGTQFNQNGITEGSNYSFIPLIENTLTFSKSVGNHNFSAMAGNTWQNHAKGGGIGIFASEFDNTEVKNVFLGKTKNISGQDSWNYAYLSYFGRFNYQFNNKYLLTLNVRRDGSPRFSPQNRWATFPSVAVAWKMENEQFIKNLKIFDQLKFRLSWGISGNDAIGDFRYSPRVWTNGVYYPLGGVAVPGATVKDNASVDIKWESTDSRTVGLDMAFLNNALTVTADYFIKKTSDILFTVPRPASLGYGLAFGGDAIVNAASAENKGFEIQVGYRGKKGDLNYSINANYSNINNNVTGLGLGQPYLSGVSRTDIGNPIGYFYGFVAEGIFTKKSDLDAANAVAVAKGFPQFQEASTAVGDVKFKDLNGDGHITFDGDRQLIGSPIPKHFYGFNLTLDYKGFDLNALFQGIAGSDIFYGNHAKLRGGITTRNQEAYVLDRWRSESNPGNGIVPRAVIGDPNNNNRASTNMVSSGDFLKLRQLSLGYSLPKNLSSKIGFKYMRFYASANNLLTFSKYHGFDPEVGGDNLNRGIDNLTYPNSRSMVLGLKMGF